MALKYVPDKFNTSFSVIIGNQSDNATLKAEDDYWAARIVPGVFAVIFLVGVIGNGTLIFIVLRNKTLHTTPNIFIVSLSIGDFFLLLVSVPFFALIYTYPNWQFGEFLCKLNGFLKALSLGVSIFTLTALSVDRYIAITFPMRSHMMASNKKTILTSAGIWLLSALCAVFEGTIIHVEEVHFPHEKPLKVCRSDLAYLGNWFKCFRAWFRFVIYFLIPILIIGILYSLMARKLWQSQEAISTAKGLGESQQGHAAARQAEARRKVAKLVLSIVVLFILCWLPRHIFLLWFNCPGPGEYNLFWHVWKIASFCLCFSNSCINPIALYILSDQFHKYFNRYFCCRWRKGKTPGHKRSLLGKKDVCVHNRYNNEVSMDVLDAGHTTHSFM